MWIKVKAYFLLFAERKCTFVCVFSRGCDWKQLAIAENARRAPQYFDFHLISFLLVRFFLRHPCRGKWNRSISGWTAEFCTSEIILFYWDTTTIKQQGKNFPVSQRNSWHERRCWHMRWLCVNNPWWALLDAGFSIAWNQLAMIQEFFWQRGTIRTVTQHARKAEMGVTFEGSNSSR